MENKANESSFLNFWDKTDPEEEAIYKFEKELQDRYAKIDAIYKSLIPNGQLERAKNSSIKEREKLQIDGDDSYVYGEITFRSLSYIYETMNKSFGSELIKGNFYDLGSVSY